VQEDVLARRRHIVKGGGVLTIGDNSGFSSKTEIDYTGAVLIGSGVIISGETTILSHSHPHMPKLNEKIAIPLTVEICDDAWVGERVLIVPSEKEGKLTIGRNSVIGAGSVVTKSVPEFALLFSA
jgi:acetyltransferase-like isoleucine patch superfamily enzyme